MKKTHEILGFTEHEYEMLILQLMLDWAGFIRKRVQQKHADVTF